MSKRLEYIDIAKGLGILLVVMGHNDFGLVSPFFYKFIYSFHMPLFFFLSGMFFKIDQPLWPLMQRRFNSLMKPYLVAILMIFFMSLSFTKINLDIALIRVVKALYANGHYLDWVQLWFLPHLFVLNIFAYGYYRIAKIIVNKWISLLMLCSLFSAGVFFINVFWPFTLTLMGKEYSIFGLPYSLDLILVSGLFFILGREVNNNINKEIFAHPVTLIASLAGLLALITFFPQTIDFNTRSYPSLLINTAESLLGITFILSTSIQLERFSRLSNILRYIGVSSLIILIFHVPIQEAWGEKGFYLFNNQIISYWIGYFAGVIFPILINYFIIQPNPIISKWFGQEYSPRT